ncbi:MAG: hypothetical protein NT027_07105 [Proteobacteria bacterium]|nr:hypothetical protein [Pseudomonadota bacterium]
MRSLRNISLPIAFSALTALNACKGTSSSEESETQSAEFGGARTDVTGTIISQNGSQTQMHGWFVALMEQQSGAGRIAEADGNGSLKFSQASVGAVQTALLLSPDFLVQSVMSIPSTKSNTVRQYFQLTKNTIPRLIQKGGVINFQNTDTLNILDQYSTDTDGDGIPDGVASLGLAAMTDSDSDGTANEYDFDLDGDGLPNTFDSDDDGDGILDALDSDSNGNGVNDTQERFSDMHFKVGFEYINVQQVKNTAGTTFKFIAKVREGITPSSVKIRGATTLLANSTYTSADTSGAIWDFSLADDGKNGDANTKDSLYARSVTFASGVMPRTDQAIFFQLAIGEGPTQFVAEFPFVFPELTLAVPSTSYAPATRTVTLAGDPFGSSQQEFLWLVTVTNSDGLRVYESNPIAGSQRAAIIPSNILQTGKSYTYKVTARAQDKVTGYSSLIVESDDGTISN